MRPTTLLRGLGAAAAAAGLLLAPAAAASAHHPLVAGVATCDPDSGLWDLAWTVRSDDPTRGKQWRVVQASLPEFEAAGWVDDAATVTAAQDDAAAGTYEVSVEVTWRGGPKRVPSSGSVSTQGECERSRPEQPPAEVTEASSEAIDCDAREVLTTTTTTTTEYVFDEVSWTWLPGEPVTTESTSTRPATEQECPSSPPPATPPTTPPAPAAPTPPSPPVESDVVTAAPATEPVGELAQTGTDPWRAGSLAGALLIVGAALVRAGRRAS